MSEMFGIPQWYSFLKKGYGCRYPIPNIVQSTLYESQFVLTVYSPSRGAIIDLSLRSNMEKR